MRFECQHGCTKCCDRSGFVHLTGEDAERIASYLGLAQEAFEAQYAVRRRTTIRIDVPEQGQCPFLGDGGCSIHAVKPLQCRTFPFWPDIIESRRSWHETGKLCPGIGKGELVQIEFAEKQAEEMRSAHPHLYRR
jgi:Fe-S-cluster containining protein